MIKDPVDIIIRRIHKNREVRSKAGQYVLYENSPLGNRPLIWNTYQDIIKSGWTRDVCIRSKQTGWKTRYNISLSKLRKEIDSVVKKGMPESMLVFNQLMPDPHLTIQGEITEVPTLGTCLTYTTIKKPMKRALAIEQKYLNGLQAKLLLERELFPPSLEEVNMIRKAFPDSVIEFSSYETLVGELPGRNTIIWEVRDY